MTEGSGESRIRLPSRTTPTWEVELLISGAVVFALLQAREALETWFLKWIAIAVEPWDNFVLYGYIYGKLVLLVLITTFVLHIAARAAWVALVGVSSVYPDGPNWNNVAGGPIAKRVARSVIGDIDAAVERADNRAALVFAYGILAAQFSMAILIITMLVLLLIAAFTPFNLGREAALVSAVVLTVPPLIGSLVDKLWGARLREGGLMERYVKVGYRLSQLLALGRFTQPLLSLITTNVGGKRGSWMLMAVIYLAVGVTSLDTLVALGKFNLMRDGSLPAQERAFGSSTLHYANERDPQALYANAPYIPDRVVEGPYLRLYLPIDPRRHEDAMREHCPVPATPAAEPPAPDADEATRLAAKTQRLAELRQRDQQRMDCFLGLFDPHLNGSRLPNLRAERYRDPLNDQDGALVLIDVRDLPPGRHELSLQLVPRGHNALWGGGGGLPTAEHLPFWR